jgi:hypothetical protein
MLIIAACKAAGCTVALGARRQKIYTCLTCYDNRLPFPPASFV